MEDSIPMDSIPYPEDANSIFTSNGNNPGAKIWLVPSDNIVAGTPKTLNWANYPNGYVFEENMVGAVNGVPSHLISYTYIPPESINLGIGICAKPTIGISVTPNTVEFGYIYPGGSSAEQLVDVIITQTPEEVCVNVPLPIVDVEVGIELGAWTSTEMSTGITTLIENPVAVTDETIVSTGFTATASSNIVPGEYSQTITVSATF